MDNSLNIKTVHVCRTCLEEIINTSCFHLNFTQVDSEPTIGQKLSNCIPELDLNIVPKAVICEKCADTINSLYLFKKECLRLETQFHEYIQQAQETGGAIDLAAVIQFHQRHSTNLITEFKTEVFEKTETYKTEECTTSFCDNYAFNETEGYTEIANMEYLTSLQMVDRECVLFNTFENFINSDKSEAGENSDTHDERNILHDCLPHIVENFQNLNKTDNFFQCFTCGHKAESKLKLIRHMKSHTAKKLYQKKTSFVSHKSLLCWYRCNLCNYSTKSKCLFSFHNRAHLTKKDYHCILKSRPILVKCCTNTITKTPSKDNKIHCGSRSSNKHNLKCWSKSLRKYSESKQQSNQYNVSKLAIDTNIIVNNMLTHTGEKPLKCSVCEYSCNRKNHLNRHMRTHTDEKLFKCSVCEYSCNYKSTLKSHVLTHRNKKPFRCAVCKYSCKHKNSLNSHMLTHTSEKPFRCSACEYSCNYKNNLNRHMITHTDEKPFKCPVCGYRCNSKNYLNRHMLTHTDEKPFKCSVCEYGCNYKSTLKNHVLTHRNEKPFRCAVCKYSCKHKNSLNSHMLTHTSEKPFRCSACEYSCNYKNNLKSHMLTHTGEKPFKCSFCDYSCKYKRSLDIHMLTHIGQKTIFSVQFVNTVVNAKIV